MIIMLTSKGWSSLFLKDNSKKMWLERMIPPPLILTFLFFWFCSFFCGVNFPRKLVNFFFWIFHSFQKLFDVFLMKIQMKTALWKMGKWENEKKRPIFCVLLPFVKCHVFPSAKHEGKKCIIWYFFWDFSYGEAPRYPRLLTTPRK